MYSNETPPASETCRTGENQKVEIIVIYMFYIHSTFTYFVSSVNLCVGDFSTHLLSSPLHEYSITVYCASVSPAPKICSPADFLSHASGNQHFIS